MRVLLRAMPLEPPSRKNAYVAWLNHQLGNYFGR
jgi:hypothetical protein